MHMLELMSNPSNTMNKREKLQSKGQQQEKTYNQGTHGTDTELSKREPSQRGSAVTKGQTLECEVHVHS
jgi:hypothetical protein